MRKLVILTALSLIVLFGATPLLTSAQPKASLTSKPATSTTTASAPAKVQMLLKLHRTGGFAGTDDTMTVLTDGNAKLTGKLVGDKKATLKADVLAALQKALDAAEITADAKYTESQMADGFHYELTYRGHVVAWEDEAKLPKKFEALSQKLQEVWIEAQAPAAGAAHE